MFINDTNDGARMDKVKINESDMMANDLNTNLNLFCKYNRNYELIK